jgi:acyl-CoA dehydrogenase
MPTYRAPVDEVLFLLRDVFQWERYANVPGFSDLNAEMLEAVLRQAARLCEDVLQPLNQTGDREGCRRLADGAIATPNGFREAYRAYAEGGWIGLAADQRYGGQGLPYTIAAVMNEFSASANMAFSMYPGLTITALSALLQHGTEAQKAFYGPKMTAGRWSGTMNLTEPHCGTDLGLLRTKAAPLAGGAYAISGQKIFISAGEHDLAENIVHLVLARIEGAPAGTKGLSLFIVPKFVHEDPDLAGRRNAVSCGSIENKMGIHGNSTCVMNFDGAIGFLLGEPNRGLPAMFVMMNEARLGVAVQGLAQSEVAYQNAAAYARTRLQMRALTGAKFPDQPADPLIVQPDVRRNLLEIRAFNEAARALVLWTALRCDVARRVDFDQKARQEAEDHLGLMTPLMKGFLTDRGFDNAVKAQQLFGGHGYIRENGMEQFVRDARIAMIYEGANAVQAIDLVGRKLPMHGGRAIIAFFGEVGAFIAQNELTEAMRPYVAPLREGLGHLQQATMWFMNHAMTKPDNAGAGSYAYMHLFGLVGLGFMWAQIARASLASRARGAVAREAMEARLMTGRFFMERMLPETQFQLTRIMAGGDALMAMPAEYF